MNGHAYRPDARGPSPTHRRRFRCTTNSQAVQLSAARCNIPYRGTGAFSGSGVSTTGLFDPKDCRAGCTYHLYHTGTNGCANNTTIAVTVNPDTGRRRRSRTGVCWRGICGANADPGHQHTGYTIPGHRLPISTILRFPSPKASPRLISLYQLTVYI